MSILGFFIRFTVSYTLIMAAAGVSMGLLGVEKASVLNTPILIGISYWCFYAYSKSNSKVIISNEKWKLISLAVLGDILASLILGTPTMLANDVPIKFLLVGMAFIIPLHIILFIAVNFVVKKQISNILLEPKES